MLLINTHNLFDYLVLKSEMDEKNFVVFINKSQINYADIGRTLGVSPTTAKSRINDLIEHNILVNEKDRYILNYYGEKDLTHLKPDIYYQLLHGTKRDAGILFIVLLNDYIVNNKNNFAITKEKILRQVDDEYSYFYIKFYLDLYLDMLQRLGYLKYGKDEHDPDLYYIYFIQTI